MTPRSTACTRRPPQSRERRPRQPSHLREPVAQLLSCSSTPLCHVSSHFAVSVRELRIYPRARCVRRIPKPTRIGFRSPLVSSGGTNGNDRTPQVWLRWRVNASILARAIEAKNPGREFRTGIFATSDRSPLYSTGTSTEDGRQRRKGRFGAPISGASVVLCEILSGARLFGGETSRQYLSSFQQSFQHSEERYTGTTSRNSDPQKEQAYA